MSNFNAKYYSQKLNPISGELNMSPKRFVGFEDIVLTSFIGDWDFSKGAYNKRVVMSSDNNITINVTKLKNGMIGTLLVGVDSSVIKKDVVLNITEPVVSVVGDGMTELSEGEYVFYLICFDDNGTLKVNVKNLNDIDNEFISGSTNPVQSQVIQKTLTILSATPPNVFDFRIGTKWIDETNGDEYLLYDSGTHRVWMQTSTRNQTVYNQLETLIISDDIIADYTLQSGDNKLLVFDSATEIEFLIPVDSEFRTGSQCIAWQKGDGQIRVVGETGVTLRYPRTDIFSRTKDSLITIIKVVENDFILSGDIA